MAGAPVYNLARDFFNYLSDNTVHYVVGTTDDNGNAQTTPATPIAATSLPAFPRGWVMRKAHGAYVDGGTGLIYRNSIPLLDPADAKWVGGTDTFTKGGQVFVIEGRIGERRTSKGG